MTTLHRAFMYYFRHTVFHSIVHNSTFNSVLIGTWDSPSKVHKPSCSTTTRDVPRSCLNLRFLEWKTANASCRRRRVCSACHTFQLFTFRFLFSLNCISVSCYYLVFTRQKTNNYRLFLHIYEDFMIKYAFHKNFKCFILVWKCYLTLEWRFCCER